MISQLAAMYKSHPEALCPPDAHHPVFQGRALWSALTMKPIPKRGIEGSMNSQIPTGTVNSQIPKAFVNPMIGGHTYSQIPKAFVNPKSTWTKREGVYSQMPTGTVNSQIPKAFVNLGRLQPSCTPRPLWSPCWTNPTIRSAILVHRYQREL